MFIKIELHHTDNAKYIGEVYIEANYISLAQIYRESKVHCGAYFYKEEIEKGSAWEGSFRNKWLVYMDDFKAALNKYNELKTKLLCLI